MDLELKQVKNHGGKFIFTEVPDTKLRMNYVYSSQKDFFIG